MKMASTCSDEESKKQFASLKGWCVSVMKERNISSIHALQQQLVALSCLQPSLVEYIIFPLRMSLQQAVMKSDEKLIESSLMCINAILTRSTVNSQQTFTDLYRMLCVMLDHHQPPETSQLQQFTAQGLKSEATVTCVLSTIKCLLLNGSKSVIVSLYADLPALGHAVSVILQVLEEQKERRCRETAIHALISLSCCDSDGWKETIISSDGIAHDQGVVPAGPVISSFIPGITMALSNTALEGVQTGQAVISMCLLGLTHFTVLASSNRQLDTPTDTPTTTAGSSLAVQRNEEWWKKTDNNLQKLSSRLSRLTNHDSWKVRKCLCYWATTLLTSCSRSLPVTCGVALEVILVLRSDTYSSVSTEAVKSLKVFSGSLKESTGSDLSVALEEKLYQLLTTLPRVIRGQARMAMEVDKKTLMSQCIVAEDGKLSLLQLLLGYLESLGSHVSQLTSSPGHLTRLVQALTQTIQLDEHNNLLVEMEGGNLSGNHDNSILPPLYFTYLRKLQTQQVIQSICHVLGCHGNLPVLLDHMIEECHNSSHYACERLLLIYWIMCGVDGDRCDGSEIGGVVEGVVMMTEEEEQGEGSKYVYYNSFILAIIAECAVKLGSSFDIHLQLVINYIMECVGSINNTISTTAITAATSVALALNHKYVVMVTIAASQSDCSSVPHLITSCSDYLVNEVSLKLSHQSAVDSACHVMEAILAHGYLLFLSPLHHVKPNRTYNVLPLMEDSKEALLLTLPTLHYTRSCWRVLLSLARRLEEWVAIELPGAVLSRHIELLLTLDISRDHNDHSDHNNQDHSDSERQNIGIENIAEYFKEHLAKKEKDDPVDIEDGTSNGNTAAPDAKKSLPPAVQSSVDIIRHCVHYLPSPDPLLRLQVLQCLYHCIYSLRSLQDVLLPEVHKVWSPFVFRLSDAHTPVQMKSLETLTMMSSVCTDFLRRRVVKEVWPKLLKELDQLLSGSYTNSQLYRHTQECKLLRMILSVVTNLVVKLQVSIQDSEQLLQSCIPYLQCTVSADIQCDCVDMMREFSAQDPDLIWLLLVQLCPSQCPPIPHTTLHPLKLPSCSTADLYEKNVRELLNQ